MRPRPLNVVALPAEHDQVVRLRVVLRPAFDPRRRRRLPVAAASVGSRLASSALTHPP